MAINERLVHTASAAAGGGTGNQEEGLILHLDANDVDSYDGDGTEWVDIANHEYTPATNVSEHFNTVTYTGTGVQSHSITEVGFQPDLVWFKSRDDTYNHVLYDSLRGTDDILNSNSTIASESNHNRFTSFDDYGFTLFGNDASDLDKINRSNTDFVAWCFKAGGAPSGSDKVSIDGTSYATMSAAGLTDGNRAINKLSVNTKLGFSIATIDNKILNNGSNVAHGLGVQPELILAKQTDNSADWIVFSKTEGGNRYLVLNSTATSADDTYWGDANPTSTLMNFNWTNAAQDYVFYSFASKRGVSKVGSYTGDGGTSNKVYTGFEPAFVMVKRTDSTSNWRIFDNVRGTEKELYANSDAEEPSDVAYIDFNRDGFTLTNSGGWINSVNSKFIYYAVAKNTNETSLTPTKDDFTAGSVETTNLELDLDANSYSGSGDWLDGTSNDYNATITGASYTDDGSADYFSFNGSSNWVNTNYTPPSGSGNFSVETWVYYTGTAAAKGMWSTYNNSGTNREGIGLVISSGIPSVIVFDSAGSASISASAITAGWHHFAVTYAGGLTKLYIDGQVEPNTVNQVITAHHGTIGIGLYYRSLTNVSNNWDGKIGQFRVYESVLTPAQIESNYEATRIYNTPELKLHLDAGDDDSTSSNWQDLSSNDYTATFTGITYDEELGNSYNFVGGSSEVLLNDSGSLTNNANFTVEMWLNSTDNSDYQELWGSMNNAGGARQIYARMGPDDKIEITAYSSNNSNDYRQVKTINAVGSKIYGKWTHLSIVMSSQKITGVYINGESEPITTLSGSSHLMHLTSTTNFGIGGWQNAGTGVSFNGNIGQVRMYHSALTQYQIRQNYNFTKPNYPNGHNFIGNNMNSSDWNTNGYFSFNGSNEHFSSPIFTPSLTDVQTVSYWVRNSAISGNETVYSIGQTGGSNSYVWISFGYVSSSGQLRAFYGDTIGDLRNGTKTNSAYISSDWQHHCFLIFPENRGTSSQCFKIYIDGVEAAVTNSTTSNGIPTVQGYPIIGRYSGQDVNRFSGDLSSLRVYDRRLTEAEITALHNEGR
jgi:hypothetical protein